MRTNPLPLVAMLALAGCGSGSDRVVTSPEAAAQPTPAEIAQMPPEGQAEAKAFQERAAKEGADAAAAAAARAKGGG